MEDEGVQTVELYIYDLTQGMAALMSGMLLGQHFDGIWHTAVVVHGREYFYGSQGIQSVLPVSKILFYYYTRSSYPLCCNFVYLFRLSL